MLAKNARIITVDLRGHGRSDKPNHGYRIPRLAADLRDLLQELDLCNVTLLGWSVGAPVIWNYLELFGRARVCDIVVVRNQTQPSPLQRAVGFGCRAAIDD